MGKINGCLKCLFIFFNVIFAIFGCLMVIGLFQSSAYSHELLAFGTPNLAWGWVYALGVLGTSCLGIYAGCSEKPLILKIFAGLMGVGMIVMVIFGIIIAGGKKQVKNVFQEPEVVKALMQHPEMTTMLNELQPVFRCCGFMSASDWGSEIPSSCACTASGYNAYVGSTSGCTARPRGTTGPNQIYEQPCNNYLLQVMDMVFNAALGICFGFAVIALIGLLISLLMIHQVKRADNAGTSFTMKGY